MDQFKSNMCYTSLSKNHQFIKRVIHVNTKLTQTRLYSTQIYEKCIGFKSCWQIISNFVTLNYIYLLYIYIFTVNTKKWLLFISWWKEPSPHKRESDQKLLPYLYIILTHVGNTFFTLPWPYFQIVILTSFFKGLLELNIITYTSLEAC